MRQLELGETILRAISLGGVETCIGVPAWKLCLDIGRCPREAVRWGRVLFTHAHVDHMGGVVQHCSQRHMLGMKPPEYVVPVEVESSFNEMMEAWRRLSRSELPHTVHGVAPGERVEVGRSRWAQAFRAIHRVPTVGYALIEARRKLRPDLVGQPGEVIRARRLAGEEVVNSVEVVELAFCGDTVFDVVEREELVRAARILVLEVTFLEQDVSVESARRRGHVHLDELVRGASLLNNEHIVLTHFSGRYPQEAVDRILDERLPPELRARTTALTELIGA